MDDDLGRVVKVVVGEAVAAVAVETGAREVSGPPVMAVSRRHRRSSTRKWQTTSTLVAEAGLEAITARLLARRVVTTST